MTTQDKRLDDLEKRVKALEATGKPIAPKKVLVNQAAHRPPRPIKHPAFVLWLKEDWLMKLGGFLICHLEGQQHF